MGGTKATQMVRQQLRETFRNHPAISMEQQAGGDEQDADPRHCEGKENRILEHLVGKIAEVESDSDAAEDRVGAAHQEERKKNEAKVDQAIDGFADFIAGVL